MMIPFLLAENPQMNRKEAFEKEPSDDEGK